MKIKPFSSEHIKSPFTYSVGKTAEGKAVKKQLKLWQKITAVGALILFSPLLLVGGGAAFLTVTAAFKNKNINKWNKKNPIKNIASIVQNPPSDDKVSKKEKIDSPQDSKVKVKPPKIAKDKVEAPQASPEPYSDEIKAKIGQFISPNSAAQQMDVLGEDFENEELVIVASGGNYQYAIFKGIVEDNTGLLDIGDGKMYKLPLNIIHKIENDAAVEQQNRVTEEPLQIFFDNEITLETDFLRTAQMKSTLLDFPNYDSMTNRLQLNDEYFTSVSSRTQDFFNQPTACCGSILAREVLTLNPAHSPKLKGHFDEILKILESEEDLNDDIILKIVKTYIRENIFPTHSDPNLITKLFAYIAKKNQEPATSSVNVKGTKVAFIPIDDFIETGLGVCRHYALVAGYILDGLTKTQSKRTNQPFLSGIVQLIRDDVPGGGHAWVTLVNDKKYMHFDALWDIVTDFSKEKGRKALEIGYSKEAIDRQLKKTRTFAGNSK